MAAKAADAHLVREPPPKSHGGGDIKPDDAISDDVLANHQPSIFDFYDTLEQKGCFKLLAEARRGTRRFTSDDGKLGYLSGIVERMQKMGRCN